MVSHTTCSVRPCSLHPSSGSAVECPGQTNQVLFLQIHPVSALFSCFKLHSLSRSFPVHHQGKKNPQVSHPSKGLDQVHKVAVQLGPALWPRASERGSHLFSVSNDSVWAGGGEGAVRTQIREAGSHQEEAGMAAKCQERAGPT